MHIAIMAGEASGDQLGAELIKELKIHYPHLRCDGVGGDLMKAEGFTSLLPMKKFSVMGITEILKALPRLLWYRRKLHSHYRSNKPDLFIGIDYPEFNLSLENRLKKDGIATMHYVSPSVWAWREERIHHIKESCDVMLTLFSFEKSFYDKHGMPAAYCGHPLVDVIPDPQSSDLLEARKKLSLDGQSRYLAVLPGSRAGEVTKMLGVYVEVIRSLRKRQPDIECIIPAATEDLQKVIEGYLAQHASDIPCHVFSKQGHTVMQASNAVLLTSGTATLEAMLLEKPMLVSYKVSGLTARLAKKRLNVEFFSLPNLLANKALVPEFMQDDIDIERMAESLEQMFTDTEWSASLVAEFKQIRAGMRPHAAQQAAAAIKSFLSEGKSP